MSLENMSFESKPAESMPVESKPFGNMKDVDWVKELFVLRQMDKKDRKACEDLCNRNFVKDAPHTAILFITGATTPDNKPKICLHFDEEGSKNFAFFGYEQKDLGTTYVLTELLPESLFVRGTAPT
jgi:hypothetical protein